MTLQVTKNGVLLRQGFEVITFTQDGRVHPHHVAANHAEQACHEARKARAEIEKCSFEEVRVYGVLPTEA